MLPIQPLVLALALCLWSGCSTGSQQTSEPEQQQEATSRPTAHKPAATPANQAKSPPKKDAKMNTIPAPEDVSAAPAEATTTASGLAYRVIQAGSGTEHPGPTSSVTVHYSGWTTDGRMFDSSVVRGQTISFPLNGVIKGWTEGVQLMVKGEKTRFWIPAGLAYGETPRRPGAPAGMLVFDIELFEFK